MSQDRTGRNGGTADAAVQALYPFLYAEPDTVDSVLLKVQQSTVDKTREITELRRTVAERDGARLMECATDLAAAFAAGGRLLTFGNGGSSTDAQDIASLFLSPPGQAPPLPACCLTNDIAVLTALSNDVGFDVVFSRQVNAFGRRGDVALGLSTSGNSANLLRAFDAASRRGLLTIGIAGDLGGKMAELDCIDYLFVVPSPSVHRIQEAQTTVYHTLWELTIAAMGTTAPAPPPSGDI